MMLKPIPTHIFHETFMEDIVGMGFNDMGHNDCGLIKFICGCHT